jgi:chemotaxis protein histidine kinase CheA
MQFLQDVAETSLTLMREYIEDEALIPAIGRAEMINIPEFKNSKPLCYQITVESGTEDMESKIGKQLMFNHVIQFAGSQLDPKQLGRMIRTSPYANNEQAFEDMTLDYDNATNMLLSLDRGEQFQPNPQDDSSYMMKRLVTRSRKADFKQLSPEIQQNYMNVYQQYVQIGAQQAQAIKDAEAGFIPTSGGAVTCELYVPDPNNKSKQQRVRVPYDSLQWLIKRIEEQGVTQQGLAQQTQQVQSDVGTQLTQQQSVQPNMVSGVTQPPIQV